MCGTYSQNAYGDAYCAEARAGNDAARLYGDAVRPNCPPTYGAATYGAEAATYGEWNRDAGAAAAEIKGAAAAYRAGATSGAVKAVVPTICWATA